MKKDIPLSVGREVAGGLIDLFAPVCERIAIVGSVRRQKPIVHDVELLLEPKTETREVDLFGTTETISLFEEEYAGAVAVGPITPVIGGQRLKRFVFREVQCELFVCIPPSQWGLASVIRTGPAEFSHRLVTPKSQGGWLPNGFYVKDLGIHAAGGDVIVTPTEQDVFDVIGRPYIPPEVRS